MSQPLRAVLAAATIACAASLPACYAEAEGPPPTTITSADLEGAEVDGYAPAYYDGYVVYYDSVGRPFYYNGGAAVWVPYDSPHYSGLVAHWRLYGPAYGRWNARYGYRYRAYRGARGYHSYHGYHGHRR